MTHWRQLLSVIPRNDPAGRNPPAKPVRASVRGLTVSPVSGFAGCASAVSSGADVAPLDR